MSSITYDDKVIDECEEISKDPGLSEIEESVPLKTDSDALAVEEVASDDES